MEPSQMDRRTYSESFIHELKEVVKLSVPIILFLMLIGVLIWDMHKVKEMSDIIHDDHRDIWVSMNESSLRLWYTPLDLCMLKVDKPGIDLKSYRMQNCSMNAGGKGAVAQKLFCGIGSSLGRPCTAPLSTKPYFKYKLRGDRLGDPFSGNLKRALTRIAIKQKPLVFLGDALSKQNQDALLCEILRTDRVWATGNIYGNPNSSISNFTIHWKDKPMKLDVIFIHMAHVYVHSKSGAAAHDHAYDGDQTYHKENSDFADWKHPQSGYRHSHRNGTVTTYGKEASSLTLPEARDHLNFVLSRYNGLVLVANLGVWYNTRERFRTEMPDFLQMLSQIGKHNLVFFRETAAQHWNHTEHGYFANGGSPSTGSCSPLADSTPEFDWRNRDVRLIIENENLEGIHIVPFRDITAPLSDMHPDADDARDCTRFCYFPQMWQSIWREMDIISFNSSKLNSTVGSNMTVVEKSRRERRRRRGRGMR